MDAKGQIFTLEQLGLTAEEAEAKGMIVVPKADEARVRKMNRKERRAYYSKNKKKAAT